MPGPTISVEQDFDTIRVKINGVLHCLIDQEKLLGVQSWLRKGKKYVIEYSMEGGNITCEYDDAAKWKAILAELDKIL